MKNSRNRFALRFIALLFVHLLLSILLFKTKEWTTAIISLVSFAFALIFFIFFIMSDKPSFQYTIIASEGIWQRLTLLLYIIWIYSNNKYCKLYKNLII